MHRLRGAIDAVITAIWFGVFAVFGFVVTLLSLILTVPIVIYQRVFRTGVFEVVPPEILEDYDAVIEAMETSDIAFLEARRARDPEFINGVDGFIGRRWLTNAIDLGSPETVAWFLEQGAEVNFRDDEGFCPLDSAIQREGDHEFHKAADPSLNGESGAVEVIEMLLDAGADVNFPDVLHATPLHFAAMHGGAEVVQLLLDRGADPLAYDADYTPETPIHRAQAAERHDIVALMKAHAGKMTKAP